VSKRTQRRAEQRRANRENREHKGVAALAQQAPTGSTETALAQQAPTGGPETNEAKPLQPAATEPKPTTSEAQIAANRENATHSTGPTSDLGKAIVSQNRTVHGLNYNPETFRVLACEDQAQYESCFNQQTAEITDQKLFSLYLRYAITQERAVHKCLTDLLKLRSTRQKIEFGSESEKRRVDRHRAFLDLEELNFILKEQKMLMAQIDIKPMAHPDMWPERGQKDA
jgi:hypothetical protein